VNPELWSQCYLPSEPAVRQAKNYDQLPRSMGFISYFRADTDFHSNQSTKGSSSSPRAIQKDPYHRMVDHSSSQCHVFVRIRAGYLPCKFVSDSLLNVFIRFFSLRSFMQYPHHPYQTEVAQYLHDLLHQGLFVCTNRYHVSCRHLLLIWSETHVIVRTTLQELALDLQICCILVGLIQLG
jgi:hypothetical protein